MRVAIDLAPKKSSINKCPAFQSRIKKGNVKYLGFYLEKEIRDRFGQRERKALIVFIEFGRKPENSLINKCPEFLHHRPLEFNGTVQHF